MVHKLAGLVNLRKTTLPGGFFFCSLKILLSLYRCNEKQKHSLEKSHIVLLAWCYLKREIAKNGT